MDLPLSPEVEKIMRAWREECWQREVRECAERNAARARTAPEARVAGITDQQKAEMLEKHMARRLLFECGPAALNVTINRGRRR
jgi:hypothetical protein